MADAKKPRSSRNPGSSARPNELPATGSYSFNFADFTYVRRKRKPPEEEEAGELNIVPYLDIMVNLIMFLLVTQATMVSLGVVNVTAPTYAAPGGGGAKKVDPQADLKLTVGVASDGFYIAAKGGVLGEETTGDVTADGVTRRAPTIPMIDGKHDYKGLTRKLRSIKTVFPKASSFFLAADSSISYDVIVKTLDATREDTNGELFPAVAFSKLR